MCMCSNWKLQACIEEMCTKKLYMYTNNPTPKAVMKSHKFTLGIHSHFVWSQSLTLSLFCHMPDVLRLSTAC